MFVKVSHLQTTETDGFVFVVISLRDDSEVFFSSHFTQINDFYHKSSLSHPSFKKIITSIMAYLVWNKWHPSTREESFLGDCNH